MNTQKHLPKVVATVFSLIVAGCVEFNPANAAEENVKPPPEPTLPPDKPAKPQEEPEPRSEYKPEPEPEPEPSSSPSASPSPSPTPEPDPEPSPSPSPSSEPEPEPEPAEYEPSCDNETTTNMMQFDVGTNVPEEDLAIIHCGLANGQDFLDRKLGGGISYNALDNITVRVVADGSSSICCTATASRIFFDVTHPHWAKDTEGRDEWPAEAQREKIVIHEFAHSWQGSLACLGRLGGSLWDEGVAEQVTYATVIENGFLTKESVMDFMESAAKSGNGEQWNTPLRDLEANGSSVWPGHIGYLALEFAMNMENATYGPMSLRTICEKIGKGDTREQAFQTTFGTSLDSFYTQFEEWKDSQTA